MPSLLDSPLLFFSVLCATVACSNSANSPTAGAGGAVSSAQGGAAGGPAGSGGSFAQAGLGGTAGSGGAAATGGATAGAPSNAGASNGGGATVGGASGVAGAASGGSGGVSAAGAGGVSSTCPAGALLCDDFEGAGPGAADSPWTIEVANTNPDQTTHGKVELSSDRPAHGTHSVHITIPEKAAGDPAGGSPALISETKTFPALKDELWGRMLVFYKPTSQMPGSHWVNVATQGAIPNDNQQLRFGGGGGAKLNANELPSDTTTTSATLLPANKWTCFEWHVQSGTASSMHFYVDGVELTDIAVQNGKGPGDNAVKWQSVPFAKLLLGWQYWNDAYGGQMWLDDVAIGGARLPCPAP
jgi:hypothetical protein